MKNPQYKSLKSFPTIFKTAWFDFGCALKKDKRQRSLDAMGWTPFILLCLLWTFCQTMTGNNAMAQAADPVAQLTAEVGRLSNKVSMLIANVSKLRSSVADKQTKIGYLSGKLSEYGRSIKNLTVRLGRGYRQLASFKSYCQRRVDTLSIRISILEKPVAFSLRFSNDSMNNLTPQNTHLLFDKVVYNVGGGNYSNSTGLYTIPADGTYAFFLTIQRRHPYVNQCLDVALYLNGHKWMGCVATACPPGYTSSSISCFISLKRGFTVHAQSKTPQEVFGYIHTSFSGMKIH